MLFRPPKASTWLKLLGRGGEQAAQDQSNEYKIKLHSLRDFTIVFNLGNNSLNVCYAWDLMGKLPWIPDVHMGFKVENNPLNC